MTTLAATKGRDYHNEIRAERDELRKQLDYMTTQRDQWRDTCLGHAIDRDAAVARAEAAEASAQRLADELNVLRGSIAAYRAGNLDEAMRVAREALKPFVGASHEFCGRPCIDAAEIEPEDIENARAALSRIDELTGGEDE